MSILRKIDSVDMAAQFLKDENLEHIKDEDPDTYEKYVQLIGYAFECVNDRQNVMRLSQTVAWTTALASVTAYMIFGSNVFSSYAPLLIIINILASIVSVSSCNRHIKQICDNLTELGFNDIK